LVFAAESPKLAIKNPLIQIEIFFLCHFFVTVIVTDGIRPGNNRSQPAGSMVNVGQSAGPVGVEGR
jgi:hypothetical protein